jgi:hypothetical protein
LPKIGFFVEGDEFYLKGEEYFRYDSSRGGCAPNISVIPNAANSTNYMILGAPFFIQYLSVFDPINKRIAFFRYEEDEGFALKLIYLLILLVLCIPLIGVSIYCGCCKKKRMNNTNII